jgi:hypothetical protein
MSKAGSGLRSVFIAAMVVISGLVAGCGGTGGSSSSTTSAVSPSTGVISRATSTSATIAGVPVTTAVAGQPYSFQPTVANTTGTVRFTITNLPAWAKFDSSTGKIAGTPDASHVGKYPGITINLVASTQVVALPAFTITVAAAGSQSNAVTLSWQAPTENADGTTLVDLKGYKVHYGSASKIYSDTIQVTNPGLTTYVVQNLPAGKYYFAVTAYNSTGHESSLSGEVSTLVD